MEMFCQKNRHCSRSPESAHFVTSVSPRRQKNLHNSSPESAHVVTRICVFRHQRQPTSSQESAYQTLYPLHGAEEVMLAASALSECIGCLFYQRSDAASYNFPLASLPRCLCTDTGSCK
ncbi:hypothetical protein BaRGS_00025549 [Batillaria attramentaria]|uniref:Uncharacterized protein n=1 Tax=Batillaria attramentaria TaxID=370345 RepID=A0ABD0K844_9CAEN